MCICKYTLNNYTAKLTELLFTLFEPLVGPSSIQYANGQEWEDRRKWLYESLKGPFLEGYVSHFVKVCKDPTKCDAVFLVFEH